jgi:ribonuclease P protein component
MIPLRKRADFLAANAKARRFPMPGFVLLVRPRDDGDDSLRLGITVTKKIGGAVIRNRMKRRFRALGREVIATLGVAGADHVLIGRAGGVERDYAVLRAELVKALGKAVTAVLSLSKDRSSTATPEQKSDASTSSARRSGDERNDR